jgi:hypothetical protein
VGEQLHLFGREQVVGLSRLGVVVLLLLLWVLLWVRLWVVAGRWGVDPERGRAGAVGVAA